MFKDKLGGQYSKFLTFYTTKIVCNFCYTIGKSH